MSNIEKSIEMFEPDQERTFKAFRDELKRDNKKQQISILTWIMLPLLIVVALPLILSHYLPSTLYFPMYKIYSFNILLVFYAIFMLYKVKIDGDLALTKVENTMSKVVSEAKKEFKSLIEPLFESFEGIDDARETLFRVFHDLEQDSSIRKYICYVGASSIHPNDDELSKVGSEKTDSTVVAENYDSKFKQIINDPTIKIERFIQLFPIELISRKKRDADFVNGYVLWLKGQKKLLEENGTTYSLTHTLRAPFWSSSKSSIITNLHVVDLYSEGKGGISIRSRQIARQQYVNLVINGINKGKSKNKKQITPEYIDKIIEEIDNSI